MSNFCKFCGKPLIEGTCDCELFKNSTIQEGTEKVVSMQAVNSNVQSDIEKDNDIKSVLIKMRSMLTDFIIAPITTLERSFVEKDKVVPFIFGGIYLLVIFMTAFIKLGKYSEYLGYVNLTAVGVAIRIVFAFALIKLLYLTIAFFCSIKGEKLKYSNSLSIFCVASIPETILILLAFLLSYININIMMLVILIIPIIAVVSAYEIFKIIFKENKNLGYWFAVLSFLILTIIVYFVLKAKISDVADSFSGLLGNLLF